MVVAPRLGSRRDCLALLRKRGQHRATVPLAVGRWAVHAPKERSMIQRLNFYKASPDAAKALMALETVLPRLSIEPLLIDLVKLRASQINGCAYCVDMH